MKIILNLLKNIKIFEWFLAIRLNNSESRHKKLIKLVEQGNVDANYQLGKIYSPAPPGGETLSSMLILTISNW